MVAGHGEGTIHTAPHREARSVSSNSKPQDAARLLLSHALPDRHRPRDGDGPGPDLPKTGRDPVADSHQGGPGGVAATQGNRSTSLDMVRSQQLQHLEPVARVDTPASPTGSANRESRVRARKARPPHRRRASVHRRHDRGIDRLSGSSSRSSERGRTRLGQRIFPGRILAALRRRQRTGASQSALPPPTLRPDHIRKTP